MGLVLLLLCVTLSQGCSRGPEREEARMIAYQEESQEWHGKRIERLKRPDAWLSLAGPYGLKPGENRLGSAPSNDLVFPSRAPAFIGSFFLLDSAITVRIRPGIRVLLRGEPVESLRLRTD